MAPFGRGSTDQRHNGTRLKPGKFVLNLPFVLLLINSSTMAPYKQNYKSQSGDSSSQTTAGPSRPRPKPLEQRDASGLPGLSKLKGSIRQTKRLLAKVRLTHAHHLVHHIIS